MKNWFSFRALSESEVEVSIYDVIGLWGITAKDFATELQKHSGKHVTLRINSSGGEVTEGLAMFNALRRHKGGVTVQIDGLAASMASYIALAGSTVKMAENGFFMIHNVSGGAYGDAKDLRSYVAAMEKMQANIVNAYVAKTGKEESEIERLMDEESWLTAQEAKEFGFIDEITDRLDAVAQAKAFDFSKFRKTPAALIDISPENKMNVDQLQARVTELEGQLSEATNKHTLAAQQAQTNFTQLTEARNQITTLTSERDGLRTEVENLKEKQKTVDKAASEKALNIVAAIGVEAVEAEKTGAAAVDHLAQYRTLPAGSVERQEYFRAHKKAIYEAQEAEQNSKR